MRQKKNKLIRGKMGRPCLEKESRVQKSYEIKLLVGEANRAF